MSAAVKDGALGRFLPGLAIIGSYERSWFRPDLLAGITVWAMLVPQVMGYASLAGMPAVYGLYAAFAALLLYWLWGTSRELNVGPEATVAIMVATVLTPRAELGSAEYVDQAAILAILVGLVLLIGGILRLGKIADFLSRPILAGYVIGSGLLIIGSQLPNLTGIDVDSSLSATDIGGIIRNLDDIDRWALGIGIGTITLMVILRKFVPMIPGALIAVVASIVLVSVAGLEDKGVEVVGEFPSGVPLPAIPHVGIDDIAALIGPAVAIALLVYPDSMLTARSVAVVNRYRIDANREFFGVGAANIGVGLFQGFAVNGSASRSFVLVAAGARSQVANLVAAALILFTLIALAPFFGNLPTAALAGIVIVAGAGLLNPTDLKALWRYRKIEFGLAAVTVVGVLLFGMLVGIALAVGLSLLDLVMRASSPHTAVLGRVPGTDRYRDVQDVPDAEVVDGLLVYRFDAPLFFANSGHLRDEIADLMEAADHPVREVLIDAEAIYDIDATGAQILSELLDSLNEDGIQLSMARVKSEVREQLVAGGIEGRIGEDHFYLEVDDGVDDFRRRADAGRGRPGPGENDQAVNGT
jgi:SulP family sulfate permease